MTRPAVRVGSRRVRAVRLLAWQLGHQRVSCHHAAAIADVIVALYRQFPPLKTKEGQQTVRRSVKTHLAHFWTLSVFDIEQRK